VNVVQSSSYSTRGTIELHMEPKSASDQELTALRLGPDPRNAYMVEGQVLPFHADAFGE
jgi:hypothetical protein